MTLKLGFKPLPATIALVVGLLFWFVIPVPEGVTTDAWHLLAIFIAMIVAIIGNAMPIGAISIIALAIVGLTEVTNQNANGAIRDVLSQFSNPLIWLIGISIMIARGLLKTGLGARIGYLFIAMWGKRTLGISYALATSELILAPVMPSNTARGGGIIHPVMKSIASSYDSKPEKGTSGLIGRYLALTNYHANPITSAMFITATSPNPLVVDLIAKATNSSFSLSWGTWALAMLLPGLLCLFLMPLVLYLMYPPEIKATPNAVDFAKSKLKELGPMKLEEKIMLASFALMLILWAGIPAWLFGPSFAVNATTTAFIGLSILLLTGCLTWQDILEEKAAWDTIIWFAALIMMATFLNRLGLIDWASQHMQNGITHLGLGWLSASILLLLAYMYAHYFFASTTAHISAMLGAFLTAGIAIGAPPMLFSLMMAAASSLMMTLTHYATGTSPVIFSSGYVTLPQWWKAGFVMSVVNLLVFIFIGGVWWKILGFW
ncbi:DASS family sodium-coupled anion symporter [Psittacicella gerlachiana]|uniref:C4-dicarboxylate ABC transporter n=1 Tax=Psittacicella gerlachiana TaxID=2028574 RepID=A0A3A1YCQ3_9GAMM|nr:DASS family sodium-coupled anion symporter [Psittacicella gerlachiana]RIY34999.1 C4-dicarboxylate ABC transporter [Psittacicella gerlachiana]